MNTKVMEYILAIAGEQSITRAAERFYLSHADLSRHLRNVEREMGAPLFTRTPTGVRLTQAGIIFVNDAQVILHKERELKDALEAMHSQKLNRLRIMVDMPFYNRFVQMVGPRFQALRPHYTLEITSCNAFQARRALLDGTAELGVFCSATATASDLEYFCFEKKEARILFPPDYDGPTDAAGLRQALDGGMFLSLYPTGTTVRALQEQQLAAHRIFPERILVGYSQNCIGHVSRGGTCGILVSPEAALAGLPQAERPRLGDVFFPVSNVIAYSTKRVLSAVYQDLMAVIMEAFTEDAPPGRPKEQ